MDAVLFSAWKNNLPPFDGHTVTVKQAIPLQTMSSVLLAVVEKLSENFGKEPLYFVMDWHEHDGVVLPAKPTSWEILQSEVKTVAQISRLFYNGDTFVRRGFYSTGRHFYLRFYVNEPGYSGSSYEDGDFDLTVSGEWARSVPPFLNEPLGDNLQITPANAFFAERYSG